MANFFEGLWNAAKHPLDEGQFLFDVVRGKTSLKDAPGKHQEMMNKITVPILGDNKIAKNSDAIAGAIVGGVLAAPAIAGGSAGSTAGAGSSSWLTSLSDWGSNLFGGKGASDGLLNGFANNMGNGLEYGSNGNLLTNSSSGLGGIHSSSVPSFNLSSGSSVDWASVVKDATSAVQQVMNQDQGKGVSAPGAARSGFRGVQMPAMNFDQGMMSNQMTANQWKGVASGAGDITPLVKPSRGSKLDSLLDSLK